MIAEVLAKEMRAWRRSEGDEDLLHAGELSHSEELKFRGAKGAEAWRRESERHKKLGGGRRELLEVVEAGRRLCSAEEDGIPFRLPDVIEKMPFKTFNTKKRSMKMFCETGHALLKAPDSPENDRACAHVAQSSRWLTMSLHCGNEQLAWRLTFVSDPCSVADAPTANGQGLVGAQDEALQCPRQLCALIGTIKDEKIIFGALGMPSFGHNTGTGGATSAAAGRGGGGGARKPGYIPWSQWKKQQTAHKTSGAAGEEE